MSHHHDHEHKEDDEEEHTSSFVRIADRVSYAMGTWQNIVVWIILVRQLTARHMRLTNER